MAVPRNYRISGEPALANYDFVDIASGTGYITFYAGFCKSSNVLTNLVFYSDYVFKDATKTGTTYAKIIDLDFDVLLNKPLTLRGKAIVNVPFMMIGSSNQNSRGYIIAKIRKYKTTETEIAESASSSVITAAATLKENHIVALDITVPLTQLKKGDYLRLTVEGWCENTGGEESEMVVAADPQGRTIGYDDDGTKQTGTYWTAGGGAPTVLKFFCPTKIDL